MRKLIQESDNKHINKKTNLKMAKKEKVKKLNAKQRAYEKKQEDKGKKVVAWIIGCFIALAIGYLLFVASNF